jgi:uncharacterized protein
MGIAALFASASLPLLLRLFSLQPEHEFYQRELQRLTGTPLRQLQRDLGRLERSGLVAKRVHGNRAYYRAVVGHPAFSDLRGLVVKSLGVADLLRDAILPLGPHVTFAFMFGSFATGADTAESDVDVMVLGSVTRRRLASALAPAAVELGREINPVIFSLDEFRTRIRDQDHFVTSVLAGPRIWLIGDEQTLSELA